MNYLDLFSGIAGFRLGLEEAGFKFNWVGYSDNDKYPNSIYGKHYAESEQLGAIELIKPKRLPRLDFITFGFPCQDLSIAGNQEGITASRSGLFFKATEIIRHTKPRYFIFENVKNLLSNNESKDFEIVLRTIAELGYDGQWQLLNTRWFLPQNRERIFFVGYIRGESIPEIFPIRESLSTPTTAGSKLRQGKEIPQSEICSTIDSGYARTRGNGETYIIHTNMSGNVTIHENACAIRSNGSYNYQVVANGVNRPSRGFEPRDDGLACCIKAGQSGSKNLVQIGSIGDQNREAERVYDPNGIARTIKNGGGMGAKTGLYEFGDQIRRLTPIECERLQGFPDNWTLYGKDGEKMSDSRRYEMIGNAVSIPVVKEVALRLAKAL